MGPTNCGFNQYSGYLKATNDHEIHYWFFEADTEDDPTTKPIFFWTNGGPSCSGAMGLFTEQGPWRVLENMTVIYNPNTWITEVNMVFLEQPYGVGFSVVDPSLHPVAGDQNAAEDMDAMIRNFLVKFPRYLENEVYTTAESWGGHYVPMTAWQILVNNEDGEHEPHINYKGFFLGNPYTDYYENYYGFMDSLYGHGLMKASDYESYREYCWDNATAVNYSMECDKVYVSAYYSAYNSDVYALDWAQCIKEEDWSALDETSERDMSRYQLAAPVHYKALRSLKRILEHHDYDSLEMDMEKDELTEIYWTLKDGTVKSSRRRMGGTLSADYSFDVDSFIPCSEYYMIDYLRLWDVQRAFNVKPIKWSVCSTKVYDLWPDSDYFRFMQLYYTDIFQDFSMKYNITMAIYSGDDDSVCGTGGTQYWMDRWVGFTADDEVDWIPWKDEGNELGGFYTIYHNEDYLDYNALHFFTVRTAGHMVPTFEPGRSLLVLKKFLYEIKDWGVEYGVDGS